MQSHKVRTLQALLLITLEIQLLTAAAHNPFGALFSNRQARAIEGAIDLHSGVHCNDVSTYGPVFFKDVTVDVCDSTFAKQCEQKNDQICLEVTEIECDVEPYTICTMSMDEVTYKSYDMVKGEFQTKTCTETEETVQHIKTEPECEDVTRQNCITKWEFDDNGEKVWAGNEDCEDVTWKECKLVEHAVNFTVPKVDCLDNGNIIPYMRFGDTNKTQMLSKMTCEVKSSASCRPVVSTKCKQLDWQECSESPVEKCIKRDVSEPHQEREHRQKCILAPGVDPRQGPVVDIGDPAAQTTASPETEEELAAEEKLEDNKFRRGARNILLSPSRQLTPPAFK